MNSPERAYIPSMARKLTSEATVRMTAKEEMQEALIL
jgi:hypothetical protein